MRPAGSIPHLTVALASPDPLAYYALLEVLYRKGTNPPLAKACENLFLDLDGLLTGEGHPQLLPSWQHYKAYTSAFASWVKLYMLSLQQAIAMEAAGAPRDAPPSGWAMTVFERMVLFVFKQVLGGGLGQRMGA